MELRVKSLELRERRISFLFLILIFFLLPFSAQADDTVKILMLESPGDALPSEQMERVQSFNGKVFFNGQSYSGSLDVMKDSKGLYVINNIPFEKYIEGVAASEVGKDWAAEALKAQAVISRTYALYNRDHNSEKDFHLTSSVLHQTYKGENDDPLVARSVEATKGEILTYDGKPVNALYHATCGGMTELPEEVWSESYPYLKSVECVAGTSPYENWKRIFTFEKIGKVVGINDIKDIEIVSHTSTGRVKTLKIATAASETEIKATELRKLLGYKELPSTQFSIEKNGSEIIFIGSGYGHGVGLSQWGALTMAREGKTYREILEHYYPGTTLKKNEDIYSHLKK